MIKFTEAQVEAMARQIDPEAWSDFYWSMAWVQHRRHHSIEAARRICASSVIGDLIAEALAPVREALHRHRDDGKFVLIGALRAALSPTPADGTTRGARE